MKKILIVLLAPIIFASCSSKKGEIFVLTDAVKPTIVSPSEEEGIIKAELFTSNYFYRYTVDINDKATPVKFKVEGKTYDININQEGTYLMNLSSDTIIAGQIEYQSEAQARFDKMKGSLGKMYAKQDSIKRANDPHKTKSEASLLPGKSELLTLDTGCKIYSIVQNAPKSIQTKSGEKIPITYQLYTQKQYSKMFMDMLMEQLQKVEPEDPPKGNK
jgi:hypothetical protein